MKKEVIIHGLNIIHQIDKLENAINTHKKFTFVEISNNRISEIEDILPEHLTPEAIKVDLLAYWQGRKIELEKELEDLTNETFIPAEAPEEINEEIHKAKSKPPSSKCPHGLRYGIDTDNFPACANCGIWDICDDDKNK